MKPEKQTNATELDLFGRPVLPIRDRRGRPSFKKTEENQDFVAVRAASGWSQKRIAENMGIDEKTLRKNFSRELEHGALLVEGIMLDVLMHKVREGHTPSIRQLQDRLETAAPRAPRARSQPEDIPDKPLGKKEQRLEDAQNVPDDYGDLYSKLSTARRRPN